MQEQIIFLPLSDNQRALWIDAQLHANFPGHALPLYFHFEPEPDPAQLFAAIARVIRRFPRLGMAVQEQGGEPIFARSEHAIVSELTMAGWPNPAQLQALCCAPFDLEHGPLLRWQRPAVRRASQASGVLPSFIWRSTKHCADLGMLEWHLLYRSIMAVAFDFLARVGTRNLQQWVRFRSSLSHSRFDASGAVAYRALGDQREQSPAITRGTKPSRDPLCTQLHGVLEAQGSRVDASIGCSLYHQ